MSRWFWEEAAEPQPALKAAARPHCDIQCLALAAFVDVATQIHTHDFSATNFISYNASAYACDKELSFSLCAVECPARVSLPFICDQPRCGSPSHTMRAHPVPGSPSHPWEPIPFLGAHPIPGSPAHGLCRLHSDLPKFLSVTWNICWIRDTGGFLVLSRWKWSGIQSWLQIAPGNNSEILLHQLSARGIMRSCIWFGNGFFLQRTLLPK